MNIVILLRLFELFFDKPRTWHDGGEGSEVLMKRQNCMHPTYNKAFSPVLINHAPDMAAVAASGLEGSVALM